MSGIVGIINTDGALVDRQLLKQMADFMAYRGPDAQNIWIDGHVGFGHTMLRTTRESERERQPFSLDGEVWITADARVDGRRELTQKLEAEGRGKLKAATDVELILHAYLVWGENCARHLLGDFAFAIWDGRQRHLFCARDHFGVKPFHYAQVANCLIFSNTLNCVRMHPVVSDALNDQFIGDFLLFDMCREPSITAFADIKRLPPAHYLTLSDGVLRLKRYWTLPADGHIRYRRANDYVEHFQELLRAAVDDRLRTDRIGVFMSGGLDSTTIAATAHELLSEQSVSFDLRAYTAVYDELFNDQERYYSGLVAEKLGIPIHYLVADGYELYEGYERPELQTPEPSDESLGIISSEQSQQVAAQSRVVLTGYGLDPALVPSHSYGIDLLKNLRLGRLAKDMSWFVFSRRQIPQLGFRGWLKGRFGGQPQQLYSKYPIWLNQSFATRVNLPERWKQINEQSFPAHSTRPRGYQSLTGPFWPYRFETCDPGATLIPCENRHPFFDLRLVMYLLAIPVIPWCVEKELIRRAMHGKLPEPVRLRPKTVLAGDPILERQRCQDVRWIDKFVASPKLAKYVDRGAIPPIGGEQDSDKLWMNMRPLNLNLWLQRLPLTESKFKHEVHYEVTR